MSVHATCLSFLVALDLSANLLATGRYEHILIVASEIGSVGINFREPESASLLGDAAAAAVVVARTPPGEAAGLHAARLETYGDGADMTAIRGGGSAPAAQQPGHPAGRQPVSHGRAAGAADGAAYSGAFLEKLRPGLSTGLAPVKLVVPHQPSLVGLKRHAVVWLAGRADRDDPRPPGQLRGRLDPVPRCTRPSAQGRLQRGDEVLLVGTGAGLSLAG